ncbi:MAG: QueT transporter family protein [Oscillospiraceae bacterium]|nr:QueT transporter family protein [Oscillospiraceae bacterium]
MRKITFTAKDIAISAVIAALYVAVTWATLPLSFYGVQFRLSEVLVLLCFFSRKYVPAMLIACVVANFLSPINPLMDIVLGGIGTLCAVLPMKSMKNIWLAALLPALSNGFFVGLELQLAFDLPLYIGGLQVAAGEFAVLFILGVPFYKYVVTRNKFLSQLIAG